MVRHEDTAIDITTTYAYDALGRRISKSIAGSGSSSTVRYFYHDWQVCEEQNQNYITQSTYVYGLYIDEVLNMKRDGTDHYYHTDDLYNVMAITDSTGAVLERYEYGDYGNPFSVFNTQISDFDSATSNPYLFTGRRYDNESNWHYYRTRYMESKMGRFTTRDKIGIWGDGGNLGNALNYTGNNPWTQKDPYGEEVTWWCRPADLVPPFNFFDHCWLKTNEYESGMGGIDNEVPAQDGNSAYPYDPVQTVDHTGQSDTENAYQRKLPFPVDEDCINKTIRPGQPLGLWSHTNQCQSFVTTTIYHCRENPSGVPLGPYGWWQFFWVKWWGCTLSEFASYCRQA